MHVRIYVCMYVCVYVLCAPRVGDVSIFFRRKKKEKKREVMQLFCACGFFCWLGSREGDKACCLHDEKDARCKAAVVTAVCTCVSNPYGAQTLGISTKYSFLMPLFFFFRFFI